MVNRGSMRVIPIVLSVLSCLQNLCQASACDQEKLQRADRSQGYTLFPDGRCEGRFIQNRNGGPLWLASFQSGPAHFEPASAKAVTIRWLAPAERLVHIRVYSLARQTNYQMDVERKSVPSVYTWPMDVLSGIEGLSAQNLGVVAWYVETFSTGELQVYVPVSLQDGPAPEKTASFQVRIVTPQLILAPKYNVQRIDAQGAIGATLLKDQPVDGSYFPENTPFNVPLSTQPLRRGLYYLTVTASATGSKPEPAAFAFYYGREGGSGGPRSPAARPRH